MNLTNCLSKYIRFLKKASFKFDRVYFFKIDLKSFKFDLEGVDIEIIKTNTVRDLVDIILERGDSHTKRYEKWIQRNYLCYRAVFAGKVIGILWLNNTKLVEVLFGYKERIQNTNTEAWVIDGYVLEKYRRIGAYKLLWHNVLFDAKNRGIEYIYAAIQSSNESSFKVHYKLGMNNNVYKVLYYFRLFWFKIFLTRRFLRFKDIAILKPKIIFN